MRIIKVKKKKKEIIFSLSPSMKRAFALAEKWIFLDKTDLAMRIHKTFLVKKSAPKKY